MPYNSHQMTRRDVVAGSVTAMSILLSDSARAQDALAKKLPRIGVLGAGFAGLACAYELSAVGYSVEVFEARNRLGGRVHSVPEFAPGQMVEFGAELIGSNHPLWLKYARKFDIELEPLESEGDSDLILQGNRYSGENARRLRQEIERGHDELSRDAEIAVWDEPWNTPGADRFDRISLADRIATMSITDIAKYAISCEFLNDMACPPEKMNYLALMCVIKAHGVAKYWSATESYTCVNGSQILASRLAAEINDGRVHLDCPVTHVISASDSIRVRLRDGREFDFDDVVLTVPPSVWDRIEFDPPLPKELQPQMGSATKFLTAVSNRYWQPNARAELMTDTLLGMTWEGGDSDPNRDGGILVSFAGGTLAEKIHTLPFAKQLPTLHTKFGELLPGYAQHHVKSEVVDWLGDPWARGGYSFPLPGRWLQQARMLRQGFGRLHFAGEHASFGFMGFMEGGLHSGVSVSLRLSERDGITSAATRNY